MISRLCGRCKAKSCNMSGKQGLRKLVELVPEVDEGGGGVDESLCRGFEATIFSERPGIC